MCAIISMPPFKDIKTRFYEKITHSPSGCWGWSGAVSERGYGKIGLPRSPKTARAHRVSWEIHCGDIPEGSNVLHSCDNRLCVNPDHLFLGTLSDNSRDMVSKGRDFRPDNRGERAAWHKLTEEQAIDILTRRMSARKFASLYGVSRSAIFRIWEGKNWRHLSGGN